MIARRFGIVVAVPALALLVWWLTRGVQIAPSPAASAVETKVSAANEAARAVATPDALPAPTPQREALDDTPPDWLGEPYEFELRVRVPYGDQRTVFVGLDHASVNFLWLSGGPDARLCFRGKTQTASVVLDSGHLRRITLRTGVPTTVDLGTTLARHAHDDDELPPPTPGGDPEDCHALAGDGAVRAFVEGRESDDVDASSITWSSVVGLGGDGRSATPPPPPTGGITAHVVDATGTPVAGARVRCVPSTETSVLTGSDTARFGPLGRGTYTLHAMHPEHGVGTAEVRVGDAEVDATIPLLFAGCLRGHVFHSAGEFLPPRRVLWIGDDGSWNNEGVTGERSAFLFEGIANASGLLCACSGLDGAQLPVAVRRVEPTPGFDHVLLVDELACRGELTIEPVVPEGIPRDQVAVRLWQQQSGLGIHLARRDDGVFLAKNLPAGSYTCEVVAPGIGVVPAGTTWIDGRNPVHLGRFTPPSPATLVLDVAPGALPDTEHRVFDLLHLRADANLHVAPIEPLPAPALLPAGDYALMWRDRDGRTHWERFAAKNGEAVAVRLAR